MKLQRPTNPVNLLGNYTEPKKSVGSVLSCSSLWFVVMNCLGEKGFASVLKGFVIF